MSIRRVLVTSALDSTVALNTGYLRVICFCVFIRRQGYRQLGGPTEDDTKSLELALMEGAPASCRARRPVTPETAPYSHGKPRKQA